MQQRPVCPLLRSPMNQAGEAIFLDPNACGEKYGPTRWGPFQKFAASCSKVRCHSSVKRNQSRMTGVFVRISVAGSFWFSALHISGCSKAYK